jgi:hypothetical protein
MSLQTTLYILTGAGNTYTGITTKNYQQLISAAFKEKTDF